MGGFGSVLHGLRLGAKGIRATVPQIRLLGSDYADYAGLLFCSIFGRDVVVRALERYRAIGHERDFVLEGVPRFNDATNFLNYEQPERNPTFYLHQARLDLTRRYATEQCFYLVNKLIDLEINFRLVVEPERNHTTYAEPTVAVQFFEDNMDVIMSGLKFKPYEKTWPHI